MNKERRKMVNKDVRDLGSHQIYLSGYISVQKNMTENAWPYTPVLPPFQHLITRKIKPFRQLPEEEN